VGWVFGSGRDGACEGSSKKELGVELIYLGKIKRGSKKRKKKFSIRKTTIRGGLRRKQILFDQWERREEQ